jgi:preprotein translocase SecE subunit
VRPSPGQPARPSASRSLPLGKSGGALLGYFREVRVELRKVVWPTRQEAINLTAVTLALSVAVGVFLGGVDFVFQEFFRFLLRFFAAG